MGRGLIRSLAPIAMSGPSSDERCVDGGVYVFAGLDFVLWLLFLSSACSLTGGECFAFEEEMVDGIYHIRS